MTYDLTTGALNSLVTYKALHIPSITFGIVTVIMVTTAEVTNVLIFSINDMANLLPVTPLPLLPWLSAVLTAFTQAGCSFHKPCRVCKTSGCKQVCYQSDLSLSAHHESQRLGRIEKQHGS